MSVGKFLGGTIIATPAVGGGGYVIYKEVTKEEVSTDSTTRSAESSTGESDSTSSGVEAEAPRVEGNQAARDEVLSGSHAANDSGEALPVPEARAQAGQNRQIVVTGSGSSGSDPSA